MQTNDSKPNQTQSVAHEDHIPSTPIRFLGVTVRPHLWLLIAGLLFTVLTQSIAAATPLFIGAFVDAVTSYQGSDLATFFGWWAIAFVVLNIGLFASFRASGFISIPVGLRQNRTAFTLLKKRLLQHSHTYFSNRFAGAVTNKLFNATDRGTELLMMIYFGLLRQATSIIVTGLLLAFINVWLTVVYFVILVFTLGLNVYLTKRRRPYVVDYAKSATAYRGYVTDVVGSVQAVRQYARIDQEYEYLQGHLIERNQKDQYQWRMAEWNHVINNLIATVLIICMVGGTYLLLLQDASTPGNLVFSMIAMYRVAGIMAEISDFMNRFIRVYGEVEEGLSEILLPHDITDTPNAIPLTVPAGTIDWQHVTFEYGDNKVFNNFNLTIPAGQRLGLVGASGAGKTTFVSLLLRQHELTSGAITIDGQPIHEVTQDSLRANIAVVPQEPALFHRSIRDNIAYGKPDATDEEIIEVAKKAQAHDFIKDLPQGYDTLVGERGVKLSGGQKQRVAIARAMLKDAPILILDEATSALDSESEVAIQQALHILMEGKTVIAIAHRLSTLREMDRIIVLDQGVITEDGTHDTLKHQAGVYQRLWEHQAGGFVGE